MTPSERWISVGIALAAVGALILAGRYLLNPFFRLLAASGAREVMTAAALLVVLGSALLMQVSGLSMAMGAFLAGVLLSESSFRHQLEADIEPFRGILLGLFFLGVGMAIDLAVIASNWQLVIVSVAGYMLLKGFLIYGVARALGTTRRESLERAVLMAQGGEFAFVLYSAAVSAGILDREANAILTATIIISMVLTPLMVILHDRLVPAAVPNTDDLDVPENVEGSILLIGFGVSARSSASRFWRGDTRCLSSTRMPNSCAMRLSSVSRSIMATDRGRKSCMRRAPARRAPFSSVSTTRMRRCGSRRSSSTNSRWFRFSPAPMTVATPSIF